MSTVNCRFRGNRARGEVFGGGGGDLGKEMGARGKGGELGKGDERRFRTGRAGRLGGGVCCRCL